jgi:outer membrane phospholipase A
MINELFFSLMDMNGTVPWNEGLSRTGNMYKDECKLQSSFRFIIVENLDAKHTLR